MDEIGQLLEEILIDVHGDNEQPAAFESPSRIQCDSPFAARIVGTTGDVVEITPDGDERRGLAAVCRLDGKSHRVTLADLPPVPVLPDLRAPR